MTTVTRLPAPRLPQRRPGRAERRRELRAAVLGVVGLLVVLVGVPAALLLTVGNPLPTSAPSRDWLTAQVSATAVLRVLACALWVAWAHFAVCVLVEWRAARSGRGVPADVPLGGGSQLAARRLVAAVLLLAGAATLVPTGSGAGTLPAPSVSSSVSASAAAESAPAAETPAQTPAAEAPVAATSGPQKTYVVAPPDGRRYDSLWDIAERTLGDPFRYKEVFALNRDRVQDDGRKLVDANLIHPGWVLLMPADATGPGVGVPAVAPPQRSAPPAPAAPAAPSQDAPAAEVGPAARSTGASASTTLLGGGLLAAGLLVALSARRGPYARPVEGGVEEQLRLAATPVRAGLLDRALRGLAAACAAEGRPLPEIAVAYVDDDHVTLSLAGPAGAPPAPWSDVSAGRGWGVLAADVADPAPDVAAPYPALAGVALSDGTDVLVDLEAAPGLVSLEGDAVAARELAASLVLELVTNRWSDGVRVTVVGFGDDFSAAAPGAGPSSVTSAVTLAQVLDELEADSRTAAGVLRDQGVPDVLAGRLLRDADRRPPRIVVLSGPPTPEEVDRLNALVGSGRTPLAVLCVGAAPAARWRFTVEADGMLDLGVLGLRGTARRLARSDYLPVLQALTGADRDRLAAGTDLAALTPRAALVELTGSGSGAAAPRAASVPGVREPTGLAGAEVHLLGPVRVVAPGPVDPAAQARLTELVVAVALHPGGLHEAVLRAEVWPRGVEDDVVSAAVAQAQAWLGQAPDGASRLRRDATGRYALSADVHSDWDLLQAAAAAPEGSRQAELLERALAGIRGAAFSGTGPAAPSLTFRRAARDARVVGTAVARQAAALAEGRGDVAAADAALRAGLLLVPTAEPLWRELLRLTGRTAPEAVGDVARQVRTALAAGGLRPEPATDALVRQLAPEVAEETG